LSNSGLGGCLKVLGNLRTGLRYAITIQGFYGVEVITYTYVIDEEGEIEKPSSKTNGIQFDLVVVKEQSSTSPVEDLCKNSYSQTSNQIEFSVYLVKYIEFNYVNFLAIVGFFFINIFDYINEQSVHVCFWE
jgi:hypothetical protein